MKSHTGGSDLSPGSPLEEWFDPKLQRFEALDLLRAGACIWGALAHITILTGKPLFLISQGNLAVDVFIFTSGLLMYILLRNADQPSKSTALSFYLRRIFRIAPAFYIAVALYGIFSHTYREGLGNIEHYFHSTFRENHGDPNVSLPTYLLHLSFFHGLIPSEAKAVFGPAWTLSLEMQFYAVAPRLIPLFRRHTVLVILAALVTNGVANWLLGGDSTPGLLTHYDKPSILPCRIFLFIVGMTTARCLLRSRASDLALVGACCLCGFGINGYKSGAVVSFAAAFVLLGCSGAVPMVQKVFQTCSRWFWVRYLAELSYGIYLFHLLILGLVGALLSAGAVPAVAQSRVGLTAVVLAITMALSAVVLRWIENPFREYGRQIAARINASRELQRYSSE